ncbi:DUF928 domain-containing protein [Almyronema epifaneia]|uniref:DUF928 domain-containing protein n=1 Tax=Almyronema epifaneia S1 TaxID=2991925 RepID=A0ABW6IKG9_9CYAN
MKTAISSWYKVSTIFLIGLSAAAALAANVQASLSFNSPDLQAPGNREAGASRSNDSCLIASNQSPTELVALMPNTNIGLTTEALPTFYVYVPPNQANQLEFLLYEEATNRLVYQKSFAAQSTSGEVIAIDLSEADSQPSLAVDHNYYWYFSVVCSPERPDENLVVESNIRRIAPSADLTQQLANAQLQERPGIYAEAGVWYEALAALEAIDPQQAVLQRRSLLQSVGLADLANQVVWR